jgi:PAS domain S-box-containing protein
MKKTCEKIHRDNQLCRPPEERLPHAEVEAANLSAEVDPRRLLHELRVHQVELQAQNEELRQARADIETLLDKYTDLYEMAPIGYFTLDGRGTIILANLTGAALLGRERGRLLGAHLEYFFTPGSRASYQAFLGRLRHSSPKGSCEARLAAEKGGHPRYLHIEGTASEDGPREARQYRLAVVEITERKRAEDDLRQFAESQQTLLRCLPVGVIMVDAQGCITELNAQGEQIIGCAKMEALGKNCHDVALGGLGAEQCPLHIACATGSITGPSDLTIVNKQKAAIPVRTLAAPVLGHQGNMVGAVMTFQDISQLKALERERENIASMFAHDIRAPLANIMGFAQLLCREKRESLPLETRKQYGEIIREEGSRLENLINDFLEFTRLAAGSLSLIPSPTDLTKELLETGEAFRARLEQAGINLEWDNTDHLPHIQADRQRLRRVFTNLLENAFKYSSAGSTINLGTYQTENHVMVKVRDHGRGIGAEELPHIFEMFFRGKHQKQTKGYGLGLAGVDAIVKSHGGRIEVISELGKGSTFTVILPKDNSPTPKCLADED